VLPLQITSILGLAMAVFGIVVLLYVLGLFFIYGKPPPGFPFLASIIAIFSGAQLFSLGIIGEYLWRMYYRIMGRPSYVIRDKLTSRDTHGPAGD
jgi:undecaprenyl-phosphate 4-deoxy-4-formamido-L-arabinose transferase